MQASVNRHPARPETAQSFAHLRRLTDDTGILEHALGRIPRRCEGYTADDNARALWTVTEWLDGDLLTAGEKTELKRLADIYIAYMLWSQKEDGWWHNNIAYDRTPEREEISHDCQGRAIWACADAWIRLDGTYRDTARIIVERAMRTLGEIDSLRGQAFTMAACAHLLEASRQGRLELSSGMHAELSHHLIRIEKLLNGALRQHSDASWRWFEPAMTYSNGVLPWAMLRAYRYTQHKDTLDAGIRSLSFLLEVMTTEDGFLRPIGNESWCTADGDASLWDQQPLELFKLALAMEEAALALEAAAGGSAKGVAAGGVAVEGVAVESAELVASVGFVTGSSTLAAATIGKAAIGSATLGSSRLGTDAHAASANIVGLHGAGAIRDSSSSSTSYRKTRDLCLAWYHGDNDLQVPVADRSDGSCCDGLTPYGPNINCGAEATISYLMTEALCRRK